MSSLSRFSYYLILFSCIAFIYFVILLCAGSLSNNLQIKIAHGKMSLNLDLAIKQMQYLMLMLK